MMTSVGWWWGDNLHFTRAFVKWRKWTEWEWQGIADWVKEASCQRGDQGSSRDR